MSSTEQNIEATIRKKKQAIGAVAVTILLLVTVFAILGYVPFLIWIAVDLVVAGVANLLIRRVSRRSL